MLGEGEGCGRDWSGVVRRMILRRWEVLSSTLSECTVNHINIEYK